MKQSYESQKIGKTQVLQFSFNLGVLGSYIYFVLKLQLMQAGVKLTALGRYL